MRTNFRLPGEAGPFANERLSGLVGGMRLARQHQLHGPLRVGKNACQPLAIMQQKSGAFVSGEPPCESQCQCLRIQHRLGLLNLQQRCSVACLLPAPALPGVMHKSRTLGAPGIPDLLVIRTAHSGLQAVQVPQPPFLSAKFSPQAVGVRTIPCRDVNAIRYVPNRHLVLRETSEKLLKQPAADLSMPAAHAIYRATAMDA